MSYAKDTKTDSAKTESEIRSTLIRFGADGFMSAQNRTPEGIEKAMIAFSYRGKMIRFVMSMPSLDDKRFTHTPETRQRRTAEKQRSEWQQACKARWRALLLSIKAKLVSIEEGISTVEKEFLAWIVLPNGQTAGEHMIPRIDAAASGGEMPLLTWDGKGGDR